MDMTPIGFYRGNQQVRQQQPRQGRDSTSQGVIELLPHQGFEQALEDLEGFSHLWVIFQFHLNESWKPKVSPPLTEDGKKKGLFATRSPHRPNPIGLSVVVLLRHEGLTLHIAQADLLDGTPILDIKPYLPYADSFPQATTGWVPERRRTHTIFWRPEARLKAAWLKDHTPFDFEALVDVQLTLDPLNKKKRRLEEREDGWIWSFRTWRLTMSVADGIVSLRDISSGYTPDELLDPQDTYNDKKVHLLFCDQFPHNM